MLTPQEVSERAFPKASFGGYNMAQVDEFLDLLTADYTSLYNENAVLKSKMKVLVEKVEEYRATEDAMRKALMTAVRTEARRIGKYIAPPHTTDFAVMFLPSEGLYAEVLRTPGLFERLQREFRITPAGPTVIAALLNSLLMGFMTLAMEKRSSEVWKILAEVKTDFAVFSRQFETVEKKFREAQSSLEQMSVKSRRMGARMQAIDALADGEAASAGVVPKLDEGEAAAAKCVNDAF